MLLPRLLRQQRPEIKIGFFFHTPFPAFEIYRMLPAREELLIGVLSANLVGFHTPDYQRHFLDSCLSILPHAGLQPQLLSCSAHSCSNESATADNTSLVPAASSPIPIASPGASSATPLPSQLYLHRFKASLGAFPIGIDPIRFVKACESEAVQKVMEEYKKQFQGKRVLLGIDRLDYIKVKQM